MTINWYKRGDGVLFCSEEGSAMNQRLRSEGSFSRCDKDGNLLEASETTEESESKTNPEQPALEDGETPSDPGPSGSGKRSGAGGEHQEKDASSDTEGTAIGKDVPQGPDNKTGDKAKPRARTKTKKKQS
jgi:hypothetical protein